MKSIKVPYSNKLNNVEIQKVAGFFEHKYPVEYVDM